MDGAPCVTASTQRHHTDPALCRDTSVENPRRQELTHTLRAFGTLVRVEMDEPDVWPLIEQRLPAFECDASGAEPTLRYRVSSSHGQFVVTRQRRTIVVTGEPWLAAYGVVADLQSTLARVSSGWTFIHAGVVAIDERAVLLPAISGGGKTTMVAALLAEGARYLSDEFAVIDPAGRVHPYPRNLAIRVEGGPVRRVSAVDLGSDIVFDATMPSAIVFLTYDADARLDLRPLSAGQSAIRLLRHCLGARGRPASTLAALRTLTQLAPSFEGTRGEAVGDARRLVDQLTTARNTAVSC